MWFELDRMAPRDGYKLLSATIVPRPIAWVVTADAAGGLNAAPFSFFNLFADEPPTICLGVMGRGGRDKDTAANIRTRGEFVVNLVPERLAAAMNVTAGEHAPEVDELALAGLALAPGLRVGLPRIAASPVAFECTPTEYVDLGGARTIVVARVLAAHIDDGAVLDAQRCHVDTPALGLIARMHGGGIYARTGDTFTMARPATPAAAQP